MPRKSIHMSKLWRGAVFALSAEHGGNIVWYHVDWIQSNHFDFTAIHNHKQYHRPFIPDRWCWLRS